MSQKDNLISRQAAIDKFEPWLKVRGYSEGELNMLKAVLDELRFLPSVQPEILACGEGELNVPDTNVGDMIHRQAAIDALRTHERKASKKWFDNQLDIEWNNAIDICCYDIEDLPSAQPDEEKISDTLYNIYRQTSPHTSAEGVAAIKYYIAEIWREIYGEEGPGWLKK